MRVKLLNGVGGSTSAKQAYFIAVGLSVVLSFTPLRLLSLLIVLYIVGRILRTSFGLVTRLVLAFLIVVSLNSILAAIAWVVNIPLSSALLLNIYNVVLLAILLSPYKTPSFWCPLSELRQGEEWAAVLLSLATAIILWAPLGMHPNATKTLPVIAGGGDNSAHLSLVKVNDLNKGYAFGLFNRIASYPGPSSYPESWHFNTAFLKWIIEPAVSVQSPGRILLLFYSCSVLWFGLMTFLMARLSLSLGKRLKKTANKFSGIGSLLVCASTIAVYLIPLFVSGFQTQISAFALLLGELYFLFMAYQKRDGERYIYLLLAGLMVAGLTLMWQFLTPVAALFLAACVLQIAWSAKKWPPLAFIVIAAGLTWAVLFQFIIQASFVIPSTKEHVSIINLTGYVPHVAMYPLLTAFLIITAYLYLRKSNLQLRLIYLPAAMALTFSLVLMAYQLTTVKELRYYYFKSTYTYVLLAAILLGSMGTELVASLLANRPGFNSTWGKRLHRFFLLGVVATVGAVVFWSSKSTAFDDLIHSRIRGIGPGQASAIAQTIDKDPSSGYLFAPIASCNRGDDIRATLFAHALAYSPPNDAPLMANFELEPISKERLFKEINEFLTVHKTKIVIASGDLALSNELLDVLGPNRQYVELINLDNTLETEPQNQCPDRIRNLTPAEKAGGLR